jgi:hypothetical protein
MADDDRKPTFSERDRMRREGGGPARGGRARADEARRSRDALAAADALFGDDPGGEEGKALAAAVRAAHGTGELPAACRAYLDELGTPRTKELASIFLDAGDKAIAIAALDALLGWKAEGTLEISGGLKRQIRLLSEDFDDDLASRAEDLLD